MVRLADLPESTQKRWRELDCPQFDHSPWVEGPALSQRKIAMVTTAGLSIRGGPLFQGGADDYHKIPEDVPDGNLLISHVSINFDRTGFQQDANVVLPRKRLREMAAAGEIGACATSHYSFMGATDPLKMERNARALAVELKADGVDSVLLIPV